MILCKKRGIILHQSCSDVTEGAAQYLDMGRSSTANWENVVAITCSGSGIAVIFNDGTLKIVGNFSGDIEGICNEWKARMKL